MPPTLPHDFPQVGRQAIETVKKVHAPTATKLIEFVGVNWGDLDGIDKIIRMWEAEAKHAKRSIDELDRGLAKLTGQAAVSHWSGNAREEYVSWRNDFKSNTLDKFLQNMWDIKGQLDGIHGNIWSIRGHVVAIVIEFGVMAGGLATAENPVSAAAAVVAFAALLGTALDYGFRVAGDLDEKGRGLQTLRDSRKIDRGGGAVSLPFNTQVIGDWSNWRD